MDQKKILRVVIMLATLALGTWIILYYWKTDQPIGMIDVPMTIMVVILGYILLQIVRRFLYKSKNWWDWLYYIGLTCIMVPIFLGSEGFKPFFNLLTDYGSFFFVIPALLDIQLLTDKRES